MTTLAELRSGLRTLLNDNAADGYLWADAALNLHLNDAIRSYSRSFPRETEATITTVAGQSEYDLPAACVAVVRVEVVGAAGRWLLQEGGDAAGTGYGVYGGKLLLLPAPTAGGQSITVRYLAPHAILALDADASTVATADADLILAFATARAIQSLATEEAKRQRFEQRAGQSAASAAALYWEQYAAGIRGRGTGVRVGRLVLECGA
jgi:hypothetical protein